MSQWIAGIYLGHNAGVCLLKDGEIIFSIEEERLSRFKREGGPILSLMKILDYTDKIDWLVVARLKVHPAGDVDRIEYTGEPLYQGIARRLGLIKLNVSVEVEDNIGLTAQSPQVVNMFDNHHQLHSAIAFYNSGFETATSVIVDSAGSSKELLIDGDINVYFETESFFDCSYVKGISSLYKKMMCTHGRSFKVKECAFYQYDQEFNNTFELVVDEGAGIGKVFDAVTEYCGFHINESGKTMGLSAFGSINDELPDLFHGDTANKDLVKAYYPNRAELNISKYSFLNKDDYTKDLSTFKCRRDMAFKCQKETQEQVLNLIIKASEMSNNKNIVLSGGYALNCVSNYYYLDKLKEYNINLYVEPNSSDAGTATGAALLHFYNINKKG